MLVLVIVAILLFSAGGSGPPTATELSDQLGCVSFQIDRDNEELFTKARYNCVHEDGRETTVYTFINNDARDNWLDIANEFGVVVVNEGDGWLEVQP
jgi:hypothetical protein